MQPEHLLALGTQRSDEPVSKSMRKSRAGVPIEITPNQRELPSSSKGSAPVFCRFPMVGHFLKGRLRQACGIEPVIACKLRRLRWYLLKIGEQSEILQ